MQLPKYRSILLNMPFNFQNMVQLFEIYHATREHVYLLGTGIMNFRKVVGVVPGFTLFSREGQW